MESFDIDLLVRNILGDLKVAPMREPAPISKLEIKTDEIFIDSRVVSLSDIKARLGDAKKLYIAPKSILTPSAKDEIRKRKIEVAVKLPRLVADHGSTMWLAAQSPAVFPANITSRFNIKPDTFETAAAVAEAALKKISDKIRAVALSRQSATVLVETNRHQNIRAIIGLEPKQTAADALEVDANLLVLHPERVGNRMMEMIDLFIHRNTL